MVSNLQSWHKYMVEIAIFNIYYVQRVVTPKVGLFVCVEILLPSQPNGVCRAQSVYLTTRLLGRLSPLSG